MKNINLQTLAEDAVSERLNEGIKEVLENVIDPNTEYKTKRKLTLEMTFETNESRELSQVDFLVKTKLAPQKAVATTFLIGTDGEGGILASEYKNQVPGQSVMRVDEQTGELKTTAEEKINEPIDLSGMKLVK